MKWIIMGFSSSRLFKGNNLVTLVEAAPSPPTHVNNSSDFNTRTVYFGQSKPVIVIQVGR